MPSNQPFQVQKLCGTLPLQDGRLKSSCRPIRTRGFHVQTRPEGRLFLSPPSQAVSEIHPQMTHCYGISMANLFP